MIKIESLLGWRDSTEVRVFTFHIADPSLIPEIPYGPPSPSGSLSTGVSPECCQMRPHKFFSKIKYNHYSKKKQLFVLILIISGEIVDEEL